MTSMLQYDAIVVWMIIDHANPDISALPSEIEIYRSYVKDNTFYIALNSETVFSNNKHLELIAAKNKMAYFHKVRIIADIALMKKTSLASQTMEISTDLTQMLLAVSDQIKLSIYDTSDD